MNRVFLLLFLFSSVSDADSLVGHWKFNEVTPDPCMIYFIGDLSPNAAGIYTYTGQHNSQNYYSDGSRYIFYGKIGKTSYWCNAAELDVFTEYWRRDSTAYGEYTAYLGASGTAVANMLNTDSLWTLADSNWILDGRWGYVCYDPCDSYHYHCLYSANTGSTRILHAYSTDGLTWVEDDANNPVLSGKDVPVGFKEDGTCHMFAREDDGIHHYTSTDWANWTPDAGNPVIPKAGSGWDSSVLDPFGIIKVADPDPNYYFWYNTVGGGPRKSGFACSSDLSNWTKYAGNPVFTGVDANDDIIHPVIFSYDSNYYLTTMHRISPIHERNEYETLLWKCSDPCFLSGERELAKRVTHDYLTGDWKNANVTIDSILTTDVNRNTYPDDTLRAYIVTKDIDGSTFRMGLLSETDIAKALASNVKIIQDSSGKGCFGVTQRAESVLSTSGKINSCLINEGENSVNDYVDLSEGNYNFDISTINFWVKLINSWGGGSEYLFAIYKDATHRAYISNINNGTMYFYCNNGGAFSDYQFNVSDTQLVDYDWNMVTIVSTGNDLCKLYFNAVEVTTGVDFDRDLPATDEGEFFLGAYHGPTGYARGFFDACTVYNTALTKTQILALYNNGCGTELPAERETKTAPRRTGNLPVPLRARYE